MPFARKLLMKGDDTSFVVAFPDDGAHKRFKTYFDGCEVAICAKVRGNLVSLVYGSVHCCWFNQTEINVAFN